MQEKLENEHYSNFCTFEIASLVNVPRHCACVLDLFFKSSKTSQKKPIKKE